MMLYTRENTIDIGVPVRVCVDGKEIAGAVSADTETGEVVFYTNYPNMTDAEAFSGEFETQTIHGVVTVEPL